MISRFLFFSSSFLADNGAMGFWDWKSGHQFQRLDSLVQPGSLDSEAGIFCAEFDKTGLRLITGEADKTIKIWKEDDQAVRVVPLLTVGVFFFRS
jgi:WD40 repeat protein